MSSAEPIELFESMFAALERLDVDGFSALFADDATVNFPFLPDPYPRECEGREEYEAVFDIVRVLFTEFGWTAREFIPTTDPELAIGRASSRAVLVNGDPYTNDYVFFLRARDGRIVDYSEYFDAARVAAAFTALPA